MCPAHVAEHPPGNSGDQSQRRIGMRKREISINTHARVVHAAIRLVEVAIADFVWILPVQKCRRRFLLHVPYIDEGLWNGADHEGGGENMSKDESEHTNFL